MVCKHGLRNNRSDVELKERTGNKSMMDIGKTKEGLYGGMGDKGKRVNAGNGMDVVMAGTSKTWDD